MHLAKMLYMPKQIQIVWKNIRFYLGPSLSHCVRSAICCALFGCPCAAHFKEYKSHYLFWRRKTNAMKLVVKKNVLRQLCVACNELFVWARCFFFAPVRCSHGSFRVRHIIIWMHCMRIRSWLLVFCWPFRREMGKFEFGAMKFAFSSAEDRVEMDRVEKWKEIGRMMEE